MEETRRTDDMPARLDRDGSTFSARDAVVSSGRAVGLSRLAREACARRNPMSYASLDASGDVFGRTAACAQTTATSAASTSPRPVGPRVRLRSQIRGATPRRLSPATLTSSLSLHDGVLHRPQRGCGAGRHVDL